VTQLPEGLGLDLADSLAGDREVLPNFLQRVFGSGGAEPKSHFDYLFLARSKSGQDLVSDLAQVRSDHCIGRIQYRLIFDKVAQMGIFLFSYWRFQRNRLLGDL